MVAPVLVIALTATLEITGVADIVVNVPLEEVV
jgi:hypothetical protein